MSETPESQLQENRYERVFATAKDGIVIVDANSGEILDVNARFQEIVGLNSERLIGKRMSEHPFSESDVADRMIAMDLGTDTVQFETELLDTAGRFKPFEFLCNRYTEQGREMIQGNVRDISRRREKEAQVQLNEPIFKLLRDGVKDYAIVLLDVSGHIVNWNKGAEKIFGYSEAEVLGKPAALIFTADDRQRSQPELEMQKASAEGWADDDRWHLRKDQTRFMASGILTALQDKTGKLQGFVKILRDVTERQRAEQLLEQARRHETIGTLAAGVAHDFNNLLTSVLGNTSLAIEELPEFSLTRKLLEEAIAATNRAAKLVEQLLAYAGKGRFATRKLELSSLVRSMQTRFEELLPEKAQLEFALAPDLPEIAADPNQIELILVNLVTNAGEALGRHKGTVRIETGVCRLEHGQTGHLAGEEVVAGLFVYGKVVDTGSGMDQHTQGKIFEPFFTTKFLGRGLGLAAVFGIVRQHKGMIQVVSKQGEGSTFQFFLPVASDTSAKTRIAANANR